MSRSSNNLCNKVSRLLNKFAPDTCSTIRQIGISAFVSRRISVQNIQIQPLPRIIFTTPYPIDSQKILQHRLQPKLQFPIDSLTAVNNGDKNVCILLTTSIHFSPKKLTISNRNILMQNNASHKNTLLAFPEMNSSLFSRSSSLKQSSCNARERERDSEC